MIIRKLLACTALAALASAAAAADLPSNKGPAPFIPPAPPIFTWTGFYVGVNAGAAFNNNNNGGLVPTGNFLVPALFPPATLPFITGGNGNNNNANFTGGLQAGYNWQFGSIVLGAEGDVNFRSRSNNNGFATAFPAIAAGPLAGANGFTVNGNGNNGNWFGTARLRAGYAIDRALIYATGGLAFGGNNNNGTAVFTLNNAPIANTTFGSISNNSNVGWTAGGGVEYAFTNNWSAKAEYLYVNLGANNGRTLAPLNNPALNGFSFASGRNDFSVARLGLNYKF